MTGKHAFLAITIVLSMMAWGFSTQAVAAAVFSDDFNDNSRNTAAWSVDQSPYTIVSETNQRLEITVQSAASGSDFSAAYRSRWGLKGDFDVQVDYWLLGWPSRNGIRIGLTPTWWVAQRSSQGGSESGPDEAYCLNSAFGYSGGISTTDTSGKLRLVRAGTVVTAYYWNGSWQSISSSDYGANGLTDVPWLTLVAWSHDYAFSHQQVKVAFDNFVLNSGTMDPGIPEPTSVSVVLCGLIGLVLRRRRQTL